MAQGAFGYCIKSPTYDSTLINWIKENYEFDVMPEQISVSPGTVFAMNVILGVYSKPGDKVVIQEPVYTAFPFLIKANNNEEVRSDLVFDGKKFGIDFDDLDRKLDGAKVFILCSPHNPVGKTWSESEVKKIVLLCKKHNVLLISDEIHCDVMLFGTKFTSVGKFFDLYKNLVVCNAPSKTFNIAGFFTSNIIFNDIELKKAYDDKIMSMFCAEPALMGPIAAETVYTRCSGWMRRQNKHIEKNYLYLKKYLEQNLPKAVVTEMDSTYLAFIDMTYLGKTDEELGAELTKYGVSVNGGKLYGRNYDGWVRFNLACPMSQLKKGLKRFVDCCVFLED
ncbi:MAG TPA: aminotransferase class I/II-fold pyridoxal phosphate-dependent enzyme [Clostridia bacterium]|nr:aminotransferase class I/II-fold pyridoxal phosphate-dependent enzyme [Clostridia bacterium]